MAYKKVMTLSATEYNAAGKIRLHAAAEGTKENIPNDSPVEKVFEYLNFLKFLLFLILKNQLF